MNHSHDGHAHATDRNRPAEVDECCSPNPTSTSRAVTGSARVLFLIQKMDCPTEEKLIRSQLEGMPGIDGLQFNLIQRELTVQHRLPSIDPITAKLKALDMEPAVKADSLQVANPPDDEHVEPSADYSIPRHKWVLMGIAGLAAIGSEVLAWISGQEEWWPVIALALLAIATGGPDTLKKGWIALRHFSRSRRRTRQPFARRQARRRHRADCQAWLCGYGGGWHQ